MIKVKETYKAAADQVAEDLQVLRENITEETPCNELREEADKVNDSDWKDAMKRMEKLMEEGMDIEMKGIVEETKKEGTMEDWNKDDAWEDAARIADDRYENDPEWKAAIDRMGKLIAEYMDREIINEIIKQAKKRKETDENIQE